MACHDEWNTKIITVYPYKTLVLHVPVNFNRLPNACNLFKGETPISPSLALDRLLYLVDLAHPIKDTALDTIVGIFNHITPGRITSGLKKLNDIGIGVDRDLGGKIGLLHGIFTYGFKSEEPSDLKKYYFNPSVNLNYISEENFKYQSKVFRVVCNDEQTYYHYMLSEFGAVEDIDDAFITLLKGKDRVNLDTVKPITFHDLVSLKFHDENLGVGSNNKRVFDRLLPYIKDIRCGVNRKTIPKSVKVILWDKYHLGKLIGKCYTCDKDIDARNFEAGHVIPASHGGPDTVDNLRTVCRLCNASMSNMNLYTYKSKYHGTVTTSPISTVEDMMSDMVIIPRDYTSKLHFHKLYRVRVKELASDYKEWCTTEGIPYVPKNLDVILSSKGCEKVTDTFVYYTGVTLTIGPGMSLDIRDAYTKRAKTYKDGSKVLRDLQRKDANIHDVNTILECKSSLPTFVVDELIKVLS